ncbi:MAG TPA: hypothetical protein VK745_10275, partial [Polyangiaceae bacterium]|nr:hypothetical protein [Polyangiaceae bacterium]
RRQKLPLLSVDSVHAGMVRAFGHKRKNALQMGEKLIRSRFWAPSPALARHSQATVLGHSITAVAVSHAQTRRSLTPEWSSLVRRVGTHDALSCLAACTSGVIIST